MNGQKIRDAQALLRKAMDELKADTKKELDNTPAMDGVQPFKGSIRGAVVSFKTLAASPSLTLSPSYYLQDCQTDAVASYLLTDNISFDTSMIELNKCVAEKAVVTGRERTYLNPNTVAALERIQAALA